MNIEEYKKTYGNKYDFQGEDLYTLQEKLSNCELKVLAKKYEKALNKVFKYVDSPGSNILTSDLKYFKALEKLNEVSKEFFNARETFVKELGAQGFNVKS